MSFEPCPMESRVADALESGRIDETIRKHLSSCQACDDMRTAALFTAQWAAAPSPRPVLPDPAVLRLRAELAARERAARRVLRPLAVADLVGIGVAALCAVFTLIWQWSAVTTVVSRLVSSPAGTGPMVFAIVALIAVLVLVPSLVLFSRMPETD